MMEDCLIEKREAQLSDVGKLIFSYPFQLNKRSHKAERTFEVQLKEKEVELDESQKLTVKVGRLEAGLKVLSDKSKRQEGLIQEQEMAIKQQEGLIKQQ